MIKHTSGKQLVAGLFILLNTGAHAAEPTKTRPSDADARWFEIELVVYKTKNGKNRSNESWRKDIEFKTHDKIIDFIPPVKTALNSQNKSDKNRPVTSRPTGQNLPTLLNKAQLQLKSEVKSLQRHPDYQVLAHYGWQQPVVNSKRAKYVRIAGGKDHAEQYQYNGARLNDLPSQETSSDVEASIENKPSRSLKLSPVQEAPSWVPELDGEILVYLNRYLHIRTNLYLREPGKEEIDVVDLTLMNNKSTKQNSLNGSVNKNAQLLTENTPDLKAQNVDSTDKRNAGSQFSWEINDDFLDSESEKMYIERLFNYPMKQSRRVRSGELHYFDHPLMGLLVIIRPVKLAKTAAMQDPLAP